MAGRKKTFDEGAVLDRAMEIFRENGYHATCFSRLVDELGVGRQSLYNTYGDKRTLFLRALDRYIDVQTERRRALLSAGGDPRERLKDLLKAIHEAVSGSGCRACMIIHTATDLAGEDDEIRERVRRSIRSLEADVRRLVAEAAAQRPFPVPADTLTSMLTSHICSLSVLHAAGFPPRDMHARMAALTALL